MEQEYIKSDIVMYDRESLPQCIITNTTSPREYGQKLLNRKKGKRK